MNIQMNCTTDGIGRLIGDDCKFACYYLLIDELVEWIFNECNRTRAKFYHSLIDWLLIIS